MSQKHIVIIGAGPGGLTAGMILAKRGYKVSIFEREAAVGGRNTAIRMNGYTFDTGPTFLMMSFVLREMFTEAGRLLDDYCTLVPLDPMYKLSFAGYDVTPTTDRLRMKEQIAKLFPGNENGVDRFYKREKTRYDVARRSRIQRGLDVGVLGPRADIDGLGRDRQDAQQRDCDDERSHSGLLCLVNTMSVIDSRRAES